MDFTTNLDLEALDTQEILTLVVNQLSVRME
jgi:hypothetical protein